MKSFKYRSGKEVRGGDQITYHGEPGEVEFLVSEVVGDPALDWYLDQFPGGGFMIKAKGFGPVFVTDADTDEDLVFVSRAREVPK
jgi:hypothetical protein